MSASNLVSASNTAPLVLPSAASEATEPPALLAAHDARPKRLPRIPMASERSSSSTFSNSSVSDRDHPLHHKSPPPALNHEAPTRGLGSANVPLRPNPIRPLQTPRGNESSHLRGQEREAYNRKRDLRLAHYKQVDAFKLHVEDVLWI